MNSNTKNTSKAIIFDAIKSAAPTQDASIEDIEKEALALLAESEHARPALLSDDMKEAFMRRIATGLVIGTSCESIQSLAELAGAVETFLDRHQLPAQLKVQNTALLQSVSWGHLMTDKDIMEDNSVGLCLANYAVAETGSIIVHSGVDMPVLLNFLPLYQLVVVPRSTILPFLDDYALIANEIASKQQTPRNTCLITGASGTTDIEGVLVQGAHGPEFLHIIIIDEL